MITTEVILSLEKKTEIKINNFEVIRALELCVFSSIFPTQLNLNNCVSLVQNLIKEQQI